MQPQIRTLVDISDTSAALQGHADIVLERARWAATIFQRYDRATTMAIVDAVAGEAHAELVVKVVRPHRVEAPSRLGLGQHELDEVAGVLGDHEHRPGAGRLPDLCLDLDQDVPR